MGDGEKSEEFDVGDCNIYYKALLEGVDIKFDNFYLDCNL